MDRHPSCEELADFLAGRRSSRLGGREIVRHLLSGCSVCRSEVEDLHRQGELPSSSHLDYGGAFAVAERTLSFFLSAGGPTSEPPGVILGELGRFPDGTEPRSLPLTPERRALPFLVRWLVEKSFSCRYASPGEALQWALMSRIAAETCTAAIARSAAKLADLRARAEAQLANALRVLGRSEEAAATMGLAWEHLGKGSGDAELRASVLQKAASLFIFQRRFETAFDSLREAAEIWRELGMRHELTRTEVMQAVVCQAAGQLDREIYLLEHALPGIDLDEDAYLPLLLRNNLLRTYVELGEQGRALAAFFEARDSAGGREAQDSLSLRLHWNEGRLLIALGMPEAGEQTLSRVRTGFFRLGLPYELILVTQDLISVQRELGRMDAAEQSIAATLAQVHAGRSGPEVFHLLEQLRSL